MNKLLLLTIGLLCYNIGLFAQLHPEAIKGLDVWCTTTELDNKQVFKDLLSEQPLDANQIYDWEEINYNPTLKLGSALSSFEIALDSIDYSKATFFSVYYPKSVQSDRVIWDFIKNDKSNLILTNQRMADLESVKYMNFIDQKYNIPTVNTYVQHKNKSKDPIIKQSILLGNTTSSNLPTKPLEGALAELLIYNRALSPQERLKVETYLSLKYGISLSKETAESYMDSKGQILWDKGLNLRYSNEIIGIGRDDAFDLYQKQSTYSQESDQFIIGLKELAINNRTNEGIIDNNNFILVGHNNSEQEFTKKEIGQPQHLNRKWLVQTTGSMVSYRNSFVQFNVNQLKDNPLKRGEIFWLSVDKSGTGLFPVGMVEYYPMTTFEDDLIYFDEIYWDKDRSSKDIFSLSLGKAMMATLWLEEPSCTLSKLGNISVSIQGGKAPYHLQLSSQGNGFSKTWVNTTGDLESINNIEQGEYTLSVVDVEGTVFREQFFIQSADAVVSKLETQYFLYSVEPLILDASLGLPVNLDYEWVLPNGEHQFNASIKVEQEGIYTSYINQNGCVSKKRIEVIQFQADNFKQLQVFPNPVEPNDEFDIRIHLHRMSDVSIVIFDIMGRPVKQQKLSGNDYYRLKESISNKGTYLISCTSENKTKTVKLVVE